MATRLELALASVNPPLDRLRGAAQGRAGGAEKALAQLATSLRGLVEMRRELEALGRMFREVAADFARAARRPSSAAPRSAIRSCSPRSSG